VRYWTVDEARAYLPRLADLVAGIREAVAVSTRASGNGHRRVGPALDPRRAIAELQDGDIILRDPEEGIIDFHAIGPDGVVYFLCWKFGEESLGWWHLPEEGFAGRKPLPRDPGEGSEGGP
jgi:hypothetical protein